MYQLIFANLDTIAMGGAYTWAAWMVTRWTHGRWPQQWIKKPEKVRRRLDYLSKS